MITGIGTASFGSEIKPPSLRFSLGVPVINKPGFIGLELRLIGGLDSSAWRTGLQFDNTEELTQNKDAEGLFQLHLIEGYEILQTSPMSIMPFLGFGFSQHKFKDKPIPGDVHGTFLLGHRTSFSGMAGIDIGLSLSRTVGLSVSAGKMWNDVSSTFWCAKFDIGRW